LPFFTFLAFFACSLYLLSYSTINHFFTQPMLTHYLSHVFYYKFNELTQLLPYAVNFSPEDFILQPLLHKNVPQSLHFYLVSLRKSCSVHNGCFFTLKVMNHMILQLKQLWNNNIQRIQKSKIVFPGTINPLKLSCTLVKIFERHS
jgi:hypothetical protein